MTRNNRCRLTRISLPFWQNYLNNEKGVPNDSPKAESRIFISHQTNDTDFCLRPSVRPMLV